MLSVSNLSKRFGDLPIFENFNLELPPRGFTVLIGPSGCGKSTLFNVLTGVATRDGGRYHGAERRSNTWRIHPPTCNRRIYCCPGFR